MGRKARDYQAEYARRIERGRSRGQTRAQARGHPMHAGSAASKPAYSRGLETAFKAMRKGQSLTSAAKTFHVAPERLRRYLRESGVAEKLRGKWVALPDPRPRRMLTYSRKLAVRIEVSPSEASRVGEFMNAAARFLRTNDPDNLGPFVGAGVTDTKRRFHPFETDENELYRLSQTGSDSFESVYRIVI